MWVPKAASTVASPWRREPPELHRRGAKITGRRRRLFTFAPTSSDPGPQTDPFGGGPESDTKSKPDDDPHGEIHLFAPLSYSWIMPYFLTRSPARAA